MNERAEQSRAVLKTGAEPSLCSKVFYTDTASFFFCNYFLDNNVLHQWFLKVLLQLFSSNNCALYIASLRAGVRERPPWPWVVWLCKQGTLTLLGDAGCLSARLLWSWTKHAGAALRGLWIFYISCTLPVLTQNIPVITSSCSHTVRIHFPLCASRWLSQVRFFPLIFFFNTKMSLYFRH